MIGHLEESREELDLWSEELDSGFPLGAVVLFHLQRLLECRGEGEPHDNQKCTSGDRVEWVVGRRGAGVNPKLVGEADSEAKEDVPHHEVENGGNTDLVRATPE